MHYQHDPVQTTKTSVHGAINMLGLAKRLRAKILQASTSEVYGDPTVHPQTEDYRGNVNCIGMRSCYDEGKRCAETLFFDYWRQHNPASRWPAFSIRTVIPDIRPRPLIAASLEFASAPLIGAVPASKEPQLPPPHRQNDQ